VSEYKGNLGEVAVVRTTGEKVYVIAENERHMFVVRRPCISENGSISHVTEEFFTGELSTLASYADEKVREMVLQTRAQKSLLKAELQLTEELEQEQLEVTGGEVEVDADALVKPASPKLKIVN
jgi:hypothetical protein